MNVEEEEAGMDNWLIEEETPKEILMVGCFPAVTDVEGDGLTGEEKEVNVSRCEAGLLTTSEILVETSGGLLVDDWLCDAPVVPAGALPIAM